MSKWSIIVVHNSFILVYYDAGAIASAIKVNVANAMLSENVTKLEFYPSVTHITVVVQ